MSQEGPYSVVPTPAATITPLRGRRVIVGVPGVGFRGDQRADDPVHQGARTYVPVLTEQDYYRAELEQVEVFAPLVPIDRVWVEEVLPRLSSSAALALDAPLSRRPVPVMESAHVLGRRLVQAVADGFVRDVRAISDVYVNAAGALSVRLCVESQWYAWAFAGTTPTPVEVPAETLWIE